MPRQRSTSPTPSGTDNPFARHMLRLLIASDDEGEAIKNLRVLREQIREDPGILALFDLAPARKRGRPPEITLATTSGAREYILVAAVLAGIKKADLLRHLFDEQKPEDRRYRWLRRLEQAIGPKIPNAFIDDLKRMDYKTRLDSLKSFLSLFDFPA